MKTKEQMVDRERVKALVIDALSGWGGEVAKTQAFIRGYVQQLTSLFKFVTVRMQSRIIASVLAELVKEGRLGRCLTNGQRKAEVHGWYLIDTHTHKEERQ